MAHSDFRTLLNVLTWVLRLWPIVVVGAVMALRHRKLQHRLAWLLLGCLVCFGVTFLVGQAAANWRMAVMGDTPAEQIMSAVTRGLVIVIAASVLISLPPLFWLYQLLSVRTDHGQPTANADT